MIGAKMNRVAMPPGYRHVVTPGGNIDVASLDLSARLCFRHAELDAAIEARGKLLGKHGRHVLNDQNRNTKVLRKAGQNLGQGDRATCRGADHNDVDLLAKTGTSALGF